MKRDSIHLSEFNQLTKSGLKRFCEDRDCAGLLESGLLEHWAWIWFLLRGAEDRSEWFPSGKWATLQKLEGMLLEAGDGRRQDCDTAEDHRKG